MSYVALSRSRTLNGLFLTAYDKAKIRCDQRVQVEMERLSTHKPLTILPPSLVSRFYICLLNVRSLVAHYQDILHHKVLMGATVLALTETWLQQHHSSTDFRHPEALLYQSDGSLHGGVALYVQKSLQSKQVLLQSSLQLLAVELLTQETSVLLVVLYKPPPYPANSFLCKLEQVLKQLAQQKCIIMGDFNLDIHQVNSKLLKLMASYGLKPTSFRPTVASGKTIDIIFSNSAHEETQVINMYFTDHKAVCCSLL